eukprot:Gb_18047 [translate_table: standard]
MGFIAMLEMTPAVEKLGNNSGHTVCSLAKTHDISALQACWAIEKSNIGVISTTSMDSTRVDSPVKNPVKAGSDSYRGGGPYRLLVSCQPTDSANVTNHFKYHDIEHLSVDGPSTPMHHAPRPKVLPTETPDSTYSPPSLSLATGSSCQTDKEVEQKVNCIESNTAPVLKGSTYHHIQNMEQNQSTSTCLKDFHSRIMHKRQHEKPDLYKENMLSLALAKAEGEQQSVQKSNFISSCSTLGTLGKEKMSLYKGLNMQQQNLNQVHNSLAQSTPNMVFSLEPSRSMSRMENSAKCPSLPMETGEIKCTDKLQEKETTQSAEITTRLTKGGSCGPQPPVTHTFSVLKCEDKILGSTCKWEYKNSASTNNRSVVSNTLPVKGFKYIPILQTPMEANIDGQDLVTNKNNSVSNDDSPILGKKRKVCFSEKHKAADQSGDFPNHNSSWSYFLKKHKVFADKVEAGLPDLKTLNGFADSHNINMLKSDTLAPPSLTWELNRSGSICSSATFGQLDSPKSDIYKQSDSNLVQISTALPLEEAHTEAFPNKTKLINISEVSPLHSNCQAFGIRPGCPPRPSASVEKPPRKMSPSESDWGKFLALSASPKTTVQVDHLQKETLTPYQHRFERLQAFLKQCDESDQYYIQTLWPLSAAARSVHAVKLESRAIMLSLEEGKEFHRMNMLGVIGKNFGGSTKDAGAATTLKLLVPNS